MTEIFKFDDQKTLSVMCGLSTVICDKCILTASLRKHAHTIYRDF